MYVEETLLYISQHMHAIFPQSCIKIPRGESGEDVRVRAAAFLRRYETEYLKGRLRVIQLPRKKAPGKQGGLIIHRHHVLKRDNNIITILNDLPHCIPQHFKHTRGM